jgi:hypothetical protein
MEISFGPGSGPAELKLYRSGRASRMLGPLWATPGHENVARFEPWCVVVILPSTNVYINAHSRVRSFMFIVIIDLERWENIFSGVEVGNRTVEWKMFGSKSYFSISVWFCTSLLLTKDEPMRNPIKEQLL